MAIVITATSPWTTGDPIGDITSYALAFLIASLSWRLFTWWRNDQRVTETVHDEQLAKHRRNEAILLAHITILSVEVARLGGNVPPIPPLEE